MPDTYETVQAVHERLDGDPWRPLGRGRNWLVPVMFTLADGREVQSNHGCVGRDEVAAYVALLPRATDLPLLADSVESVLADMPLDHHA